jgi:hypothetical protein
MLKNSNDYFEQEMESKNPAYTRDQKPEAVARGLLARLSAYSRLDKSVNAEQLNVQIERLLPHLYQVEGGE